MTFPREDLQHQLPDTTQIAEACNVEAKGAIDLKLVLNLYQIYHSDLLRVRSYQRKLYAQRGESPIEARIRERMPRVMESVVVRVILRLVSASIPGSSEYMYPAFEDTESEILYLLIRHFRPFVSVEVSPAGGWSTSWILHGLRDNGAGKLCSCDLSDASTRTLPDDLTENRWTFLRGDVRRNVASLPEKIDCLLMDSLHSADFATWYTQNLFPRMTPGALLAINDVFHYEDSLFVKSPRHTGRSTEADVVLSWMREHKQSYFSASQASNLAVAEEIASLRIKLGLGTRIVPSDRDTTLFCVFNSGSQGRFP